MASSWSFFWQSPGAVSPWIIAYLLTYNEQMSDNTKWRLVLGIGAIPAAIVVMGSIYETYYSESTSKNTNSVQKVELWESLQDPVNRKNLVATGLGWFVYDVAYYGMSLFGSSILAELSNSDDVVSTSAIRNIIMQQMIAISTGIPALVLSIYSLKYLGTKWLQIAGFIIIALSFIMLAVLIVPLKNEPNALFAIYCILLFALNFGPNLTTFVLPAETYPKHIRATYNGISSACGKIGAAIGAAIFGALSAVCSYSVIMILCAILALVGTLVSYYFIAKEGRRGSDYLSVNLDDDDEVEKI
jgi:PHS family inorganic phosphate transporter-like MFS transporter